MPAEPAVRTRQVAALAVLLLLGPCSTAPAGPPEGVPGRMVLDEVADGLRRYRAARTPEAKVAWLKRLAPSRDPRVAVALGEAATGDDPEVSRCAIGLAYRNYDLNVSLSGDSSASVISRLVLKWWQKNEADLRRRAEELPR
jgi:hypothetical protein